MPRPRKCRKVCRMPENRGFTPDSACQHAEPVILNVDEYETIRLIDREGLSQEQCGQYMGVARTTVQQIYTLARKKLADVLVDGRPIRIEGGDYRICEDEDCFACPGCWRHPNSRKFKEEGPMKIAIPLDENKTDVCLTFGRAPYIMFSQEGVQEILENPAAQAQGGAGLKAAQFLVDQQADVLITFRCGQNAADVFKAVGLEIYKAQGKTALENLRALEGRELERLTHFHAGYQGVQ